MIRKTHKRLVVDADIARAAGETAHPVSSRCRQTLTTIMEETEHKLAFHPFGFKEWRKHRSRFSQKWLASMVARKRVIHLDAANILSLQSTLDAAPIKEKDRAVIQKDLHLLEAAVQTDRTVISKDDAAKKACASVCTSIKTIRKIGWINPMDDNIDVIYWLKSGAELKEVLMLGNLSIFAVGRT